MSIVLKNRIFGYFYLNASNASKVITVYMQVSNTEAYSANFTFPNCGISYVFIFRNPDDGGRVYFSVKSAKSLADAMNQPFFSLRIPLQVVALLDTTKKSINFISTDTSNQQSTSDFFNPNCIPTATEQKFEEKVREAVIEGNASQNYTYFFIDQPEGNTCTQPQPSQLNVNPPADGAPISVLAALSGVIAADHAPGCDTNLTAVNTTPYG